MDELIAENALLQSKIDSLLQQRLQIQANFTNIVKSLLSEGESQENAIMQLEVDINLAVQARSMLSSNVTENEEVQLRVNQLKGELKTTYDEISKLKDFINKKSVNNKKLRKALLSSTSKQEASPTVKKSGSHIGVTIEEDGFILSKRLDVVQINAGSSKKLVEWIAIGKSEEDKIGYYTILCLTYRYFMTSEELIDELKTLYEGPEEQSHLVDIKSDRLNVINFVKHWIENHYEHDFLHNDQLLEKAAFFIDTIVQKNDGNLVAKTLRQSMAKKKSQSDAKAEKIEKARKVLGRYKSRVFVFETEAPEPVLLKSSINNVLDIAPIELARQLTIIHHQYFSAIQPKECLNCAWSSKNRLVLAPNIAAMIENFNLVSQHISTTILMEAVLKTRASTMCHWMCVAEEFFKLNNFNGLLTVVAALCSAPIFRLKKTWAKIPSKRFTAYQELTEILSTDGSSKLYREHIHKINPPLVPHLGLYLQDLTFIEDGNPIKLDNGMINFTKCRMIGAQILEMMQYQQKPYNLVKVPEIQDYLSTLVFMQEEEMYERSKEIEPRVTK